MRKGFKYRIYPTSKQERELDSQLESCRKVYNHFLSERKDSWENDKKGLTLYDQINTLPELKVKYPDLKEVHGQVLQNIAVRINLAFQSFFRRVRNGEKPGYPRFKSYDRYNSMTFPQYKKGISIKKGRLSVTRIGLIKTVWHRPLEGTPKTVTISKSNTGKWYVSFSCEVEKPLPLPVSPLIVGIDVGLETFAYMSDDTKIDNPRFFRQEEKELAKVQRKLDKTTKKDKNGKVLNAKSPERIQAKKVVSRVYERINWKRENFAHQETKKIVDKYRIICVEDLEVNKMVHNHCLAKSISDASWSSFSNILSYKAEDAGRTVIKVNPAYTSQDCSNCGHRQKKSLSERIHKCECCGFTCNRDLNASINILRIGLDSLSSEASC